ncbi:asparagine synthase (glutamine-hydrolyzing) [soil metagenome]
MCGIAGIIHKDNREVHVGALKKMTDALKHRGPDGEGQWVNETGNTGLGHRRLSIIDLSNAASQPMHYMNRYSIVFNGEIYNYLELKESLLQQGYSFTTSSDTEILIAYYDWKKEACLQVFDGMFAFALYDNKEQKLFCARDRFGEKPFYYHYKPGQYFYFASEMKALWAAGVEKNVDPVFIYNYITGGFLYDPSDLSKTFYNNIYSLENAHYLQLDTVNIKFSTKQYWNIDLQQDFDPVSTEKVKERFRFLMLQSVERRLRSDVPVGSSLSGGLDSSLIVSLIERINQNKVPQNTFSARFPGFKKDESAYMDMVIKTTNVIPHAVIPGDDGLIKEIDTVFYHQEEPFGSSSIYAQYCVMRLAKENNVTVLLDGQGADEVLAGYHSYFPVYFNELKRTNKALYGKEKNAYEHMFADTHNYTAESSSMLSIIRQYSPAAVKQLKIWRQLKRQLKDREFSKDFFSTYRGKQFIEPHMPATLNAYLKQNVAPSLHTLLRYADRNSMSQSREVRMPFLNDELVSFIFSLPACYKIKDGWTKWVMRYSFEEWMPKEIAWRKDKIGFEPPQQDWMANDDFKKLIMSNIELLVKERILDKTVLNRPVIAQQVNDTGNNHTWQYLMAGKMLEG